MFKIRVKCATIMSTMALAGVMGWTVSNAGAQIVLTPPVGSTQSPPNPSIASLGSGMYGWTYSISLGPDTSVSNGDSVAIVDFGGYIGTPTLTVSLSSNFTVSQTGAYLAGGLQDTNPLAYGYNNPTEGSNHRITIRDAHGWRQNNLGIDFRCAHRHCPYDGCT